MDNTTISESDPTQVGPVTKSFNIILGSSAFLLNSILLLVLWFDPLKKFRTPGTVLVTSLAVTDGLTGLFVVLRMVMILNGLHHIEWLVAFFLRFSTWTMQCSLFTILFITWERLFAVAFPICFKIQVTKSRTFLLQLTVWLTIPILLNLSLIIKDTDTAGRITFIAILFLDVVCLFLIATGYCAVYKVLKQRELSMGKYGDPGGTPQNEAVTRKRRALTENKRLTNTFLIITVILLVTVLPVIVLSGIATMCTEKCSLYVWKLYFTLEPIVLINYIVNPLLYAFQLPTYRRAFLVVFRCRKIPGTVRPELNEPKSPSNAEEI